MAESNEVSIDLNPLREQIEAMRNLMRDLLKRAKPDDDASKADNMIKVLDRVANQIKTECRGMGVKITFK